MAGFGSWGGLTEKTGWDELGRRQQRQTLASMFGRQALFKDSGISFDSAADCEKYELKVEQGMEGCRAGCEAWK